MSHPQNDKVNDSIADAIAEAVDADLYTIHKEHNGEATARGVFSIEMLLTLTGKTEPQSEIG
jgi:hypothetical protein